MKPCKNPCFFEYREDVDYEDCFGEEGKDHCGHLAEGGSWADCEDGGKSCVLSEYQERLNVPQDFGTYLVWNGRPHRSKCLGMIRVRNGETYWSAYSEFPSVKEWREGWMWTKIEENIDEQDV